MQNNSAELYFIGDAYGAFKARESKRLAPQSRCDKEANNNSVMGVLWRLIDDKRTVDRPEVRVDPISHQAMAMCRSTISEGKNHKARH